LIVALSALGSIACASTSNDHRLAATGVDGLRFGMNPQQAGRALGSRIEVEDGVYECSFWTLPGLPSDGIQITALNGQLAYIIIYERGIATTRGVRVGDGLDRLRHRYRGKLHAGRTASLGGADQHLFASVSQQAAVYELEFDINNGRVSFISAATKHVIETFGECA
jgi:hypothetical protein